MQLLCALEDLHSFKVVFRDLKPKDVLLDHTGHIVLCDFGLCKLNLDETNTTNTFCGAPAYVAPELLLGQGYTKTVDLWALEVLLYEMTTGLPSFYDENVEKMYQRILNESLRFPEDIPPDSRSIMIGLLNRDPAARLGSNGGSEEIKQHPFFAPHIDWHKLIAKQIQPPIMPSVQPVVDVADSEQECPCSSAPQDWVVDCSNLSETVQEQFRDFTYNPSNDQLSESVGQSAVTS